MDLTEQIVRGKEDLDRVYEAGKNAGGYGDGFEAGQQEAYDRFWDDLQVNGTRTDYEYAFTNTAFEYLRPKYKVIPTTRTVYMFKNNKKLKSLEKQYIDLSNCTAQQTLNNSAHYYTFADCTSIEIIEDIGLPAGGYYNTFRGCQNLHTIEKIRVLPDTLFNSASFGSCKELQNITFEGTIGQNGLIVSESKKLTHDSLMSIINALETKTSSGFTVTLGSTNLAKLTDAEKAIATQKGWTLA